MVEQLQLPAEYLTGWHRNPSTVARARIVELRAAGFTPQQVAFRLNTEGVATPSGRGRWHPTTVARHAEPERWAAYMRAYRARQHR